MFKNAVPYRYCQISMCNFTNVGSFIIFYYIVQETLVHNILKILIKNQTAKS